MGGGLNVIVKMRLSDIVGETVKNAGKERGHLLRVPFPPLRSRRPEKGQIFEILICKSERDPVLCPSSARFRSFIRPDQKNPAERERTKATERSALGSWGGVVMTDARHVKDAAVAVFNLTF